MSGTVTSCLQQIIHNSAFVLSFEVVIAIYFTSFESFFRDYYRVHTNNMIWLDLAGANSSFNYLLFIHVLSVLTTSTMAISSECPRCANVSFRI